MITEILAFTIANLSAILLPTTSVVLARSMNPIQVSLPKNVIDNEPMLDDDDAIAWRTTQHSTTPFRATKERSLYRTVFKEARDVYNTPAYVAAIASEGTPPPSSFTQYSFNFAQQVNRPSDPLQPGPIYFLTPRKCALFGACCEAIPRQVRTHNKEKN